MIIGILEADYVDSEPEKIYGSYADMFIKLLSKEDKKIAFKVYSVIDNKFPENVDECDVYLITGSRFSAYDNEIWIIELKNFIRSLFKKHKKLLGICFGHQVIAEALGGKVEKSAKGWGVGLMSADIESFKDWMLPKTERYDLLLTHQDQVVKLPEGAELISRNDFCPISSYIIGNDVLTFQGHPEFSPGYLMYLMNKRKNIIGENKYKLAKQSMEKSVDNENIAKWMLEFMSQ